MLNYTCKKIGKQHAYVYINDVNSYVRKKIASNSQSRLELLITRQKQNEVSLMVFSLNEKKIRQQSY